MPTTSKKKRTQPRKGRRTAIVAGLRSPFVKSSTVFSKHTSLDPRAACWRASRAHQPKPPVKLTSCLYGQVASNVAAPNIAREVLATGMPHAVDAYSVSRACVTSTQAIVNGALAIENGAADVVIAGGVESLSKPPITLSDGFVQVLMKANSACDTISKAKAFADLKLKDLAPVPPAIAEFSTGETMGQSTEKMGQSSTDVYPCGSKMRLRFFPISVRPKLGKTVFTSKRSWRSKRTATSLSRRIPWFALTRPAESLRQVTTGIR